MKWINPYARVNLELGGVTCSGKLSLVVEYDERTVDTNTVIQIKDKAMDFLLQGDNYASTRESLVSISTN